MFDTVAPAAPGHGHTVARGHIRIRRIEIDFPATARSQHDDVAAQRLHLAARLIQDIDAHTGILHGVTQLARGQKIHRHMVFQHGDIGMIADAIHQRPLDLKSRRILEMQNAPFRVATFHAEIEFPLAILAVLAVEAHPQLHQFRRCASALPSPPFAPPPHYKGPLPPPACPGCAGQTNHPHSLTQATPPWAQAVLESTNCRFVTSATEPFSAALSAKDSPAMPLPMTIKSNSSHARAAPRCYRSTAPCRRKPPSPAASFLAGF